MRSVSLYFNALNYFSSFLKWIIFIFNNLFSHDVSCGDQVSSHMQPEMSSVNPSAAEDNEEPMSVTAYYFDIFTVVDEQDELD